MKKLLVISEKEKANFLSKALEKLFFKKLADCYSGIEAEKVIDSEKPDFIIIDLTKPVNGIDLVSMLRLIDGNIRLRVAVFNIGFPKLKFLHSRFLFNSPSPEKSR